MGATAFPASAIISGTIDTARLGSGTADASTVLFGDQTYAAVTQADVTGLTTADSPTFSHVNVGSKLQHTSTLSAVILGAITYIDYAGSDVRYRNAPSGYANTHIFGPSGEITFGGTTATNATLHPEADHVLAQRDGTAAQGDRLYNTYTNDSNYERAVMQWATNVLTIGTEAAGTGVQRNMVFSSANRSAYIATPTAAEIRDILISFGLMAAS